MGKIYTKIMGLLMVTAPAVSIVAEASALMPLLEDGKYWIVKTSGPFMLEDSYQTFKVDGDTIVEGHTAKKIYNAYGAHGTSFNPEYDLAYEEDGKVFGLSNRYSNDGEWYTMPLIDFNARAGEHIDYLFPEEYDMEPFRTDILNVDTLSFRGIDRQVQTVGLESFWIEGIGSYNDVYIFPFPHTTDGRWSTVTECGIGDKVLFTEDEIEIHINDNDERAIVRHNRTWDYNLWHHGAESAYTTATGYHFGNVVRINDKLYLPFCDAEGNVLAHMRQHGSKVYLHVDETIIIPSIESTGADEVLLYDFSKQRGSKFTCVGFDDSGLRHGEMYDCIGVDDRYIVYDGRYLRCLDYQLVNKKISNETFSMIEGIGNPVGLLPFPQFGVHNPNMQNETARLARVLDGEGKVIYEPENVGIDKVESGNGTTTESDGRIYDLFGRQVTNPQPGSIYIQKGEKILWH